jgi:hypothetical protein
MAKMCWELFVAQCVKRATLKKLLGWNRKTLLVFVVIRPETLTRYRVHSSSAHHV